MYPHIAVSIVHSKKLKVMPVLEKVYQNIHNDKRRETVRKIIENAITIVSEDANIEKLYLFGSCATLDSGALSDVDLALVFKEQALVDRGGTRVLLDDFEIHTDLVFCTQANLDDADSQFNVLYHIKRDGILLWQR